MVVRLMTKPILTIWTNADFPEAAARLLRDGVHLHQLLYATEMQTLNLAGGSSDLLLAEADIAFGQPNAEQVMRLDRLQWVHLTSAGYTNYDRDDLRDALRGRAAALTTSSTVYQEPCAEHALAMMLALARQLPRALDVQRTDRSWDGLVIRKNSRLLTEQSVLLLGFGAIAQRLVQLLSLFDVDLTVVRRHVKGDEPVKVITESQLNDHLPRADHVVNILPSNPGTNKFIDEQRISLMKRGAIFYNIGRGTTVDQNALLAALQAGHLAYAYLDVTDPEPLPPDHPLWRTPNCFITPHTAGGHVGEMENLVKHFLANLRRFTAGDDLLDRVI